MSEVRVGEHDHQLTVPEGFLFGAATAAYQIEGAAFEDGRTASIWDTFSHTPGKVRGGDTGDVACDAYHRYPGDVQLLADLGLRAYRFSVSWPRVQPGGRGKANDKGLDYYRALVDELLERSIEPFLTLYHWDLPQELEDEGGWTSRSTAQRFGEYASIVAAALGDRVKTWITLNEPHVAAELGYRLGIHAPGRCDEAAEAAAMHHLLIAHGLGVAALRSVLAPTARVGITLDLHPVRCAEPGLDDAATAVDVEANGTFLDPILHGHFPDQPRTELTASLGLVLDGDLECISQPIDLLGVNYYAPVFLRRGDPAQLKRSESSVAGHEGVVRYVPDELDHNSMGWPIEPEGLYDLLHRLHDEVPELSLYVTENGCAAEDYVDPNGVVNDIERVKYLHRHLHACARAIEDGIKLDGYFVWSFLDNFEWAEGYQKRFGIVFVDFGTQQRIPKESARFYAEVVKSNAVPALPERWPR
jgi:beta-glucosidase